MKTCRRAVGALVAPLVLPFLIAGVLLRIVAADFLGDVADFFGGGISDVWDAIKGAVLAVVRAAFNAMNTALDFTSSWLVGIIDWSVAVLQSAINDVTNALSWWVGVLWSGIQNVINLTNWLYDQLQGALNWAIGVLWGAINDARDFAWGLVQQALQWVISTVWNPLLDAINGVIGFVTHTLPDWVNGIVNNLWCFVKDVAQSIAGIAEGVVGAVLDPFMTLLRVGLEALGWLVYFATHPFSWFADLFGHFFDNGAQWFLGKIASAVQSNHDTMDSWLSKFFGG